MTQLPVDDGVVESKKELVHATTQDLSDEDAAKVFDILVACDAKYRGRFFPLSDDNPAVVAEYKDEALTRLAEIGVLANFDPTPCIFGDGPIVEIIGKVPDHDFNKYGMDHERKAYEVTKAARRNEEFLGEKEPVNTRRAKKKEE